MTADNKSNIDRKVSKKSTGKKKDKKKSRKQASLKSDIIINYLTSRSEPVSTKAIAQVLGLDSKRGLKETDVLLEQLRDNQKISQVRKKRWSAFNQVNIVQGGVVGHFDGHGFVIPQGGGDRVFLNSHDMREVLHGDTVKVRITGRDSRKKQYGKIESVVERGNQRVVGRIFEERGMYFVVPQDQRISQDIYIPLLGDQVLGDQAPGSENSHQKTKQNNKGVVASPSDSEKNELPESGQVVICEITQQPSKNFQPSGKIIKVLGDYLSPGMEIQIAINEHFIPNEWSDALISEVAKLSDEVVGDDYLREGSRRDIRDLPLVTIDGEDARDFDDAVFCEKMDVGNGASNYRLLVAIADVSHYVKQGTDLDNEAYERGNSTYFPRQVIPMLPEKLSNGLCSLNPRVDRLCFVCDMQFNDKGERLDYEFYTAVMKSQARLTYTQVAAFLSKDISSKGGKPFSEQIELSIKNLLQFSELLGEKRREEGSIDLDIAEPVILFNDDRKIESIVPRERNIAHRLIEECMLAANVSAADYLDQSDLAGVYRVHEQPDEEKVDDARQFIRQFGFLLGGGGEPSPKDYSVLLKKLPDNATKQVVNQALLRSFKQARYAMENEGHFALAFPSYTHFTSPIRRYADLHVHRQIKRLLKNAKASDHEEVENYTIALAEQTSTTERRSEKASRDVVQWLKCEFVRHKVGEVFDGVVTSVTDFGLFVELRAFYIEGLVHIATLCDDYYSFNETERVLYGDSKGGTYRAGQDVKIKVIRVDLEQRRIDFEIDGLKQGFKSRGGKGRKSGKSKRHSSQDEKFKGAKFKGAKKTQGKKKAKGEKKAYTSKVKSSSSNPKTNHAKKK